MTAIPEMEVLIEEIDALYVEHAGPESSSNTLSRDEVQARLTVWSKALLASLPAFIQEEVSKGTTTSTYTHIIASFTVCNGMACRAVRCPFPWCVKRKV